MQAIIDFLKCFLLDTDISGALISLISGIFGFTMAAIPFSMQLLSTNGRFTNKLKVKENVENLIKPLFDRFVILLKSMFYLFIFIIILNTIKSYLAIPYNCFKYIAIITLFLIYIYLIGAFLIAIKNSIRDIKSLVNIFLQNINP